MPGTPLYILAIENSNPSGMDVARAASSDDVIGPSVAIGVVEPGAAASAPPRLLAAEPIRPGARDADDVIPAIARVAERAGLAPAQLGLVAVSIGPGGYTALRVSCAAGKMIAEAAGIPCAGVPTPMVVAANAITSCGEGGRPFAVMLAGKDDSAYCTRFDAVGRLADVPGAAREIGLVRADDLVELSVSTFVADRFLPSPIREAAALLNINIIEPVFSAATCLALCQFLPAHDPAQLLPLYPREPDAVTLWRLRKQG